MKIIADTHVHTIASEHAYSTLLENIHAAKDKGLKFLAITDHTGKMPGSPTDVYFLALRGTMPAEHDGVQILRGCEVNILDEDANLDLPENTLKRLEWVIASVHNLIAAPMTVEQSTKMWLKIAENPHVDVIGHCGEESYRFDYEQVVPVFGKYGKVVEINANSYRSRPSSVKNCVKIARLCAKHGVKIVLSSDAHFAPNVGNVDGAMRIVEEAGVPEELILNADEARFAKFVAEKTGREF